MEKWIRWEPLKNLSGKYYLRSFVWPEEGLIIELSHETQDKVVQILFIGSIDAFRYTNESFCFKIFGDLSKQYGDAFYKDFSFFKITNSDYVKWLSEKSFTWSDKFSFMHFCILGGDEVIDIIACYEPIVKFIE